MRNRMLSIVLGVMVLAAAARAETIFHVAPNGNDANPGTAAAPFATLERARDAIRHAKKTAPIKEQFRVRLSGGVHRLTKPLVLTAEDSGATPLYPIKYESDDEEMATLSGGRRIAGWKKHKDSIWVADVPDVKSGWDFRQLYVNGQLRRRARTPNEGFYRVAGFPEGGPNIPYHTDCQSFEYKAGDLRPDWTNLTDVEVIVYYFWTDSHLPIQSLDTGKRIVTFQHKGGKRFTDDFTTDGARYIVENVFEALDAPGEWYLNRKTAQLFYIPMPGENLETAEVIAPFAPALLRLEGNPRQRQFVQNIEFNRLRFMHANFVLPPGDSNDKQGSASVSAAISLAGARKCRFYKCEVRNTGTFAFDIGRGCSDNEFRYNLLTNLAAGGFRIDGATPTQHPLERTGNNVITDNVLAYYGETYPSAVGILLMNTAGNTVAHNEIHHGWYTGISIGWVWGYQRSIARDNLIEFNHIHHIGQGLLSDMGAIYTLGISPGTIIRNNLIHDVDANHYGGWGIYNDEGSSHLLIENNIVYNTKFAGYNIHFAKEVTVRNNIFALGKLEQLSRSRVEPHKSVFFENNIVYWREGELLAKNWKDKPYTFHFHPKDKAGTREEKVTFDMNYNVYFNPTQKAEEVQFAGLNFADWRKLGKDTQSVYADPLFVDAERFDFRLKPESPALKLGFRPIDPSNIGPRGEIRIGVAPGK